MVCPTTRFWFLSTNVDNVVFKNLRYKGLKGTVPMSRIVWSRDRMMNSLFIAGCRLLVTIKKSIKFSLCCLGQSIGKFG